MGFHAVYVYKKQYGRQADKRDTGIPKTAYVKDNCSYVKEFFKTTATINCEGENNKLGIVYYSDVDSEGNVVRVNGEEAIAYEKQIQKDIEALLKKH